MPSDPRCPVGTPLGDSWPDVRGICEHRPGTSALLVYSVKYVLLFGCLHPPEMFRAFPSVALMSLALIRDSRWWPSFLWWVSFVPLSMDTPYVCFCSCFHLTAYYYCHFVPRPLSAPPSSSLPVSSFTHIPGDRACTYKVLLII